MKAKNKNVQKPHLTKNSGIINIDKDPVCLLYEIFGYVTCNFTLATGVHNKCCFKVNMVVNSKRYSSTGTTYKLAKKSCALAALAELCNVYYDAKMLQPYIHVPVPSIEKLTKEDVLIVSSTNETEPKKILSGLLSTKEELLQKETNMASSMHLVKASREVLEVVEPKLPIIIEEIDVECISVSDKNISNSKFLEISKSNSDLLEAAVGKVSSCTKKSLTSIFIDDEEIPKPPSVKTSLLTTSKVLPLIIEEIDNDGKVISNNKIKKTNALQNITNLSASNEIRVKNSKTKNIQNNAKALNALSKGNNSLKKFGVKNCAKNPIKTDNLAMIAVNQTESSMANENNQQSSKRTQKRRREDCQESLEQPPAKKALTNECKTICKVFQNKTVLKSSQRNDKLCKPLKQFYPNLKFTLEAEMGSPHVPFFMVSTMVNGRKFYGHGKSKQLAEKDVTQQIINELGKFGKIIANSFNSVPQQNNQINNLNRNYQSLLQTNILGLENCSYNFLQLSSYKADIIEAKVMNKFQELTSGRQEISEYKVLAGIVMTLNKNFEQASVVSIATGTKCINGGNICCNGSVLNDSHAEIIARRCLIKFLYSQLLWHCCPLTERSSIFQKNANGSQYPFTLKPNVNFHLYISTAPCGDGRIFSFNNNNRFDYMGQPSFSSAQYGQLRTKVEGGMGTTPVGARYYPQTWDGVMLGEPLLTMSCSDKIARWNVVGIQGALLAQFTEPIYLSSIVLGSLFNAQHLSRAMFGRIQNSLNYLPTPYRLNRPLLGRTSSQERRNTYRIPSIGINWTLGDNDIEIISLPTGRQIYNETSDLSKQKFFSYYINLVQNLPSIGGAYISNNYAEAKEKSRDFQNAKNELMAAFYHTDLGTWVRKPIEQNEFTINMN